jgi:flagella basal body P-ring formation protein FlgA
MAWCLALPRAAIVGSLTFAAGALTFGAHAQPPTARQSVDEIRAAARELVLKTVGTATNAVVEAVGVDERLSLPACGLPLDAQLQRELRNGQGVVVVSCTGKDAWRLFVPVRVIEQIGVVIARRSIAAGEILTADDLETRKQSSTALPYEFIGDPAQAVGLTVRRTIPSGTVLVPAALEHPELIERGALVTLVSGGGSVSVRSEGVALESGRLNQRVRVRSPSGRVVEGVVEASGEVRVGT